MRPARLMALLATGNVLLLAVVLWQARLLRDAGVVMSAAQTIESPDAALGSAANREIESAGAPSALSRERAVVPSASTGPILDWGQVEAPDYPTYMGNLRAIGVPEQTVRDIVTADVVQGFAPRRAEVMAVRYRDLNEWQRAELELQLAFLPPDKRDSTRAVLSRYADIDAQIKELADGRRPTEEPHELERIIALYETKHAELARLITPEEFEQVGLTVSWTAGNLRRAMARFEPTEEEFRTIFHAWRAHDENLAQLSATLQPDPGNDHVFEGIREFLGEERYAEYRRTWWQ